MMLFHSFLSYEKIYQAYLMWLRFLTSILFITSSYFVSNTALVVNPPLDPSRGIMKEMIDNTRSDKNNVHCYLEVYEPLLQSKRYSAHNVLEIGIHSGGSIKLWKQYFSNATIYAMDIWHIDKIWDELKNDNRIKLYSSFDAYDEENFQQFVKENNVKFDIIIDDGSHTLTHQEWMVEKYSHLLKDDGILVVEDIQEYDKDLNLLQSAVPDHLQKFIQVYDLRKRFGRYDDVLFVINKS
jgi:hypothetical protein